MNMDEQHLEMELAQYVTEARVVKLANDGYYAVLPAWGSERGGRIRSYAQLQYLGDTYANASAYILRRWGPQRA